MHSITRVNNRFKVACAFWLMDSLNEMPSVILVKHICSSSYSCSLELNSRLSSLALMSVKLAKRQVSLVSPDFFFNWAIWATVKPTGSKKLFAHEYSSKISKS